jgi:HlyD family secretion protein
MTRRILAVAACLLAAACSRGGEQAYQGYVEGEFVYVASQMAGRLDELPVERGSWVRPGDGLFVLEHALEAQGVDKAKADLLHDQNTLNDLKKGLRPEEIDQLLARIDQTQSQLALNKLEMERRKRLLATGSVAKEEYDQAVNAFITSQGQLADLKAQLATGKLGSRVDQILAAKAQVDSAKASLDQAQWYLDQKIQFSPLDAQVFDLLHYKGEWVQAGSPVVKLLPPANVKVRFFIPETDLGKIKLGQKVSVHCDGCPSAFAGSVSFIYPQAEYTPPVIYSQDFRAKLIFMVEARFDPDTAKLLKPGQPVDVIPGGGA